MKHVLLATVLSIISCGGPIEEASETDTEDTEDTLYEASTKIWSNHTIHVCWIGSGWDTEKNWVRDAAASSWARVANVSFDDWGRCPSSGLQPFWPYSGVRIRIADEQPNCSALGKDLAGLGQTMTLNFSFNNWSRDYCSGGNRESCIRAIAAHEFGHALGFAHEQNRPDTDRSVCTDAPQGSNGDVLLGGWDLHSIMNYCNPDWNNEHLPGYLSSGDVSGARVVYGTRGDSMSSPISLGLNANETTIYGSTLNATNDGPSAGVGCASGANVWYSFSLSQSEIVYADTAGSAWDTSLYLVDAGGTVVNGFGNDDSTCTGNDWRHASGYESRVSGLLGAGTYRLAVGGCGSENFTLHLQHLPLSLGAYFEGKMTGSGTASTFLIGASKLSSACGGSSSGEDVRWYPSCGGQSAFFSLCSMDGGAHGGSFQPLLYSWTGRSNSVGDCNADASCGPRLNVSTARGINAVVVDEASGSAGSGHGMDYTLAFTVGG